MRLLMASVAAASILTGCAQNAASGPAVSAVDPGSPNAAPNYLATAGSSDQFEIQSSQLALQRSANPALRQMAQMLITDHTNSTNQLMAAAQSAGIQPPPPTLLPQHAAMLQQLQAAPAPSFDAAYRDIQIQAHQEALVVHQGYASAGDVPALRTTAAGIVPVVQNHLTAFQSMAMPAPMPMQTTAPPAYGQPARPGERG